MYVTCEEKVLRKSDELKSCGLSHVSTVQITSKMRGGGKHRDKQGKVEKERSGSPKKTEQGQGRKAESEPNLSVDEMYLLMEEQMRSMREQAMSWHVTNEDVQRIVELVVKTRLIIANMKKQASNAWNRWNKG